MVSTTGLAHALAVETRQWAFWKGLDSDGGLAVHRRLESVDTALDIGIWRMDLTTESFDREVAIVLEALGTKKSLSIRELLEKTQDSEFRKKLTAIVAPIKASNASGRYPTVAQVRKMLAANDNIAKDIVDYSEVASEYKSLFERCLADSGDVNSLIKKLSKEHRANPAALAAVVNALTGSSISKISFADAKSTIFDEFAHRGVSIIAKRAAGESKPF